MKLRDSYYHGPSRMVQDTSIMVHNMPKMKKLWQIWSQIHILLKQMHPKMPETYITTSDTVTHLDLIPGSHEIQRWDT